MAGNNVLTVGGRGGVYIVGVVTNGLFAARPADVLLLGTSEGVKTLHAK